MTKEEVKEELRFIDEAIINVVIESCEYMCCDGVPLYDWDYDKVMEYFDKATQDWE